MRTFAFYAAILAALIGLSLLPGNAPAMAEPATVTWQR
jgi:hypothetical protein